MGELPIEVEQAINLTFDKLYKAGYVVFSPEQVKALEEIRQRVADGWCAWPTADVEGQGAWRCIYSERDDKDITPEVAAVLWPTTAEEPGGA